MTESTDNFEIYLRSTYFMDWKNSDVEKKAFKIVESVPEDDMIEKAVKLFYFVRDEISYNVYSDIFEKGVLKASSTLKNRKGFCIPKAILLAAFGRALNIPTRLHFADIKNYRISKNLLKVMKTNLFVYHGYMEFYLDGNWLKANPAFDKKLCLKQKFYPVEFSGREHGLFSEKDVNGKRFIEYVKDRGVSETFPYEKMKKAWVDEYPDLYNGIRLD
ncbi:MAG: transglutaminase-like domain-containing protein [Promethearchaeota archaeon]